MKPTIASMNLLVFVISNCLAVWCGPMNTKPTVGQFKEQLASKIGREGMGKYMRLREKNNDKLTKVYHDEKQMEFYNMYEGKQLAIQMLKQPENPHEEEYLIMLQLWDPNTWNLTSIKEMYVERTCTLAVFAAMVSSIYDIPVSFIINYNEQTKNITCCKISSAWNFSKVQLPHETWHTLEGNDGYIGSNPFFLTTDGTMFVYLLDMLTMQR